MDILDLALRQPMDAANLLQAISRMKRLAGRAKQFQNGFREDSDQLNRSKNPIDFGQGQPNCVLVAPPLT